jgi:oligoendopeptidase F
MAMYGQKIHIKAANKGKLHRDLGVAQGKKLTAAELSKAKHSSNPAERKRATFAQNARGWKHGKQKSSTSSKLYGGKSK